MNVNCEAIVFAHCVREGLKTTVTETFRKFFPHNPVFLSESIPYTIILRICICVFVFVTKQVQVHAGSHGSWLRGENIFDAALRPLTEFLQV